jgi:hypothetical protein
MKNVPDFKKNLTAKEVSDLFFQALEEVSRPANERILTDAQLCQLASVSKRTTADWRSKREIAYHKVNGTIFYLLSDVLDMLRKHRIEPHYSKLNIKL